MILLSIVCYVLFFKYIEIYLLDKILNINFKGISYFYDIPYKTYIWLNLYLPFLSIALTHEITYLNKSIYKVLPNKYYYSYK